MDGLVGSEFPVSRGNAKVEHLHQVTFGAGRISWLPVLGTSPPLTTALTDVLLARGTCQELQVAVLIEDCSAAPKDLQPPS